MHLRLTTTFFVLLLLAGNDTPANAQAKSQSSQAAPKMTGVPQASDWASFELGAISSFCEMVKAGAKKLALGPPVKPEQYALIREGNEQLVRKFGVKSTLEKDFLVTDLFPDEATHGEWVSLYYLDDSVYMKYTALKKQKQQLVASGNYKGEPRKEIARSFGRLLSYPEWKIAELLGEQRAADAPPAGGAQVTFLYFNDVPKAAEFYGKTLGLHATFDGGWVKIFAISPTSSVGLVDATHGAHKPSAEKPVMVSMVMDTPDQVDGWYTYLKAHGVAVSQPPVNSDKVPVRALGFKDPEGHSLEVFAWLNR